MTFALVNNLFSAELPQKQNVGLDNNKLRVGFKMKDTATKEQILKHLENLDEDEQDNPEEMIDAIAEDLNVPANVVEQVIAEWSAGHKKVLEDDEETAPT